MLLLVIEQVYSSVIYIFLHAKITVICFLYDWEIFSDPWNLLYILNDFLFLNQQTIFWLQLDVVVIIQVTHICNHTALNVIDHLSLLILFYFLVKLSWRCNWSIRNLYILPGIVHKWLKKTIDFVAFETNLPYYIKFRG